MIIIIDPIIIGNALPRQQCSMISTLQSSQGWISWHYITGVRNSDRCTIKRRSRCPSDLAGLFSLSREPPPSAGWCGQAAHHQLITKSQPTTRTRHGMRAYPHAPSRRDDDYIICLKHDVCLLSCLIPAVLFDSSFYWLFSSPVSRGSSRD